MRRTEAKLWAAGALGVAGAMLARPALADGLQTIGADQSDTPNNGARVVVVVPNRPVRGAGMQSDTSSTGRSAAELQAERAAAEALLTAAAIQSATTTQPAVQPVAFVPPPTFTYTPPPTTTPPAGGTGTGSGSGSGQQSNPFQQGVQLLQQLLGQGNLTGAQNQANQLSGQAGAQSAGNRLDLGRQLVSLASRTEGPARGQAQQQAISQLNSVANDPAATPADRQGASDGVRAVNLTAGLMSQGQMGREVEPLLSQSFKSRLSGKIGGKICGVASLAMLAKHLGLVPQWTPQLTKKYVEGPEAIYIMNSGTDHAKLAQAATKLGFPSRFADGCNLSAIKSQLDAGKPVIILGRGMLSQIGTHGAGGFTPGGGGKSWKGHFLMIVGYTPSARQNEKERAASGGSTIFAVNDPDRTIRVVVKESALTGFVAGAVLSR